MNYDKYSRPACCSWCNQFPGAQCDYCSRWMCSGHARLHKCKKQGSQPRKLNPKPREIPA